MATAESSPTNITPTSSITGHPIGFWFFFWGEFAERSSYYGMRSILALYMTDRLGVSEGNAGTYMSLFIAACYFFPLIGGWIADNFFGKYWTIVLFSVPYVTAQFLVGIEDPYVVFGSLVCLAMGSGVIKPNISTLMGLTYDQQRPGQNELRTSAFSWFYMAINIGALLSQTAMPRLRTNFGYQAAFLFPAALMSIALIVFALGKKYYARESILRKVIGDPNQPAPPIVKTITGIPVETQYVSAEQKALDSKLKWQTLSRLGALFLTVMFFWAIFDQSASTWIFFANTYMDCTMFGVATPPDSIQAFNALFIVLLVPVSVFLFKKYPLKATTKIALGYVLTMLSMVIMSFSGFMAGQSQKAVRLTVPEGQIIFAPAAEKLDTFAGAKELQLGSLKLSGADWKFDTEKNKLNLTNGTLTLASGKTITLLDGRLLNPRETDSETVDGSLETLLLSAKEIKEIKAKEKPEPATLEVIDWVKPSERITVWWQVFAYLILTIGEILVSITGLELAFVAAPASMKGFVTACWLAVVFLANLLINAPITQLYPLVAPGIYFAGLAVAMAVVLVVYAPIASKFNRATPLN